MRSFIALYSFCLSILCSTCSELTEFKRNIVIHLPLLGLPVQLPPPSSAKGTAVMLPCSLHFLLDLFLLLTYHYVCVNKLCWLDLRSYSENREHLETACFHKKNSESNQWISLKTAECVCVLCKSTGWNQYSINKQSSWKQAQFTSLLDPYNKLINKRSSLIWYYIYLLEYGLY